MRNGLPRIHPNRKLTEEQWEALRFEVATDAEHTVRQLCERKGVSVVRFYKRFPAGKRRITGGAAAQAETKETPDTSGGKAQA